MLFATSVNAGVGAFSAGAEAKGKIDEEVGLSRAGNDDGSANGICGDIGGDIDKGDL